ncbi:hypothetical protein MUK42_20946 [Musa troglodytarum]|uniref:Uncharacterized protein n=1 Tax=Musa troglodytarum TaxID=320322 RepID=A0A9E7K5A3_9LILI|nr:hypothetical protein MUK42_20946 [Musa troglodytarum]
MGCLLKHSSQEEGGHVVLRFTLLQAIYMLRKSLRRCAKADEGLGFFLVLHGGKRNLYHLYCVPGNVQKTTHHLQCL